MATTPQFNAGDLYAIGSIGNAISAGQQANAQRAMGALQTDQLKQRIAFERATLEKQIALRNQEITRQQMYAQGVADAVAASKNQYANVSGDIGAKSTGIASAFQSVLDHQPATSIVPQAMPGAVADKEAAMRALATSDATRNANNLANVQALGEVFTDKGRALTRNNQVSGMLRNFSQGSGQVANQQINAAEGKFMNRPEVQIAPSNLGDLFVAGSTLGLNYLNNQNKTTTTTGNTNGSGVANVDYSLPTAGVKLNALGIK